MNYKLTNVLMFAVGAVIGSAVTWKVVTTKYDRLIQEEIESVKEAFSRNTGDVIHEEETEDDEEESARQINWDELEDLDEEDEDENLNEYERLVNKLEKKGGSEDMAVKPYVISPDDFGELDGYTCVSLTYYADNVLEDEHSGIITNVDELIGERSLYTFGEYEEDSVFVRNEELCTDFEILKDYRTYEYAHRIIPDQVEIR